MLLFSFTLSVLDMRVMMILLLLWLFLVTLGIHTARAAVLLTATQDVCSQHDPQLNLISPLYTFPPNLFGRTWPNNLIPFKQNGVSNFQINYKTTETTNKLSHLKDSLCSKMPPFSHPRVCGEAGSSGDDYTV